MVSEFEVTYSSSVVKLKLVFHALTNPPFTLSYWVLIVSVYPVAGSNSSKVFIQLAVFPP